MEETNTTPTPALHDQWPGAFGIVGPARDAMKRVWKPMLCFVAITIVLSLALQLLTPNINVSLTNSWAIDIVTQFASFAVSALISCAEIVTVLAALRGKQIDVRSAFKLGYPMWWRMILLNILVGLSVLGGMLLFLVPAIWIALRPTVASNSIIYGSILFIIPAIWIGLRLYLANYYLVDRQMGVMEAYKASWRDTKGELGKLGGIIGVIILMVLPTVTVVGVIATVYLLFMYWPATAMLYMYLSSRSGANTPSAEAAGAA